MIRLNTVLEDFSSAAQNPSIMLLELYPWMQHFEPPFNIGFKKLKEISDSFIKFIFEEIAKHKETFNENEPPRDYTDAYMIEMRKRQKESDGGKDTDTIRPSPSRLGEGGGAKIET
jgi:hypothetical protein